MMNWKWRLIYAPSYLWPLPVTLLGLGISLLPFVGSRRFTVRRGCVGVYGPGMQSLLSRLPTPGGAAAITLGHVILAIDYRAFDESFEHEWIHVKQYLWWWPLFLPAYGINSLWQWILGKDPYWDNDFEIQARRYGDHSSQS